MGLSLTLKKEYNNFYTDFIDAYWSIDNIQYTSTDCSFRLSAYPSREAKKKMYQNISQLSIGGATYGTVFNPVLHEWVGFVQWKEIFPNGIPVDENEQKTVIYNYIKKYTQLPFNDVLENN